MKMKILSVCAALAFAAACSANAMAGDIVSLKFSDGRADVVGLENVNAALKPIGIHVQTIDIPQSAKPILEASHTRALTKAEQAELISIFSLDQAQLLEQVKLAGRSPAVSGGGVLTDETGVGPYPKVYDMKALDEKTAGAEGNA